MSTQPNVISNGPMNFLKAQKDNKWNLLKNGVLALAGATFLAASVWVWVEPVAKSDVAMLLIKMALSFGLLCLGFIVMNLLDIHENVPMIQLDPMRRRLSVTEMGKHGEALHTRDFTGRQVVTVPVNDPEAVKAIRMALAA